MPRLLARSVRLLKFGAVAGVALGVGRMIMQRRARSQVDESSWPTIAETAVRDGQPVDADAEADASEADATEAGATEAESGPADDTTDKS